MAACFSGRGAEPCAAWAGGGSGARPGGAAGRHGGGRCGGGRGLARRAGHGVERCRQRSRRLACSAAMASDGEPRVLGLPIFPLGCVGFPGVQTPLHIFEAR